jgi:hypothetical protein
VLALEALSMATRIRLFDEELTYDWETGRWVAELKELGQLVDDLHAHILKDADITPDYPRTIDYILTQLRRRFRAEIIEVDENDEPAPELPRTE